MDQTIFLTGFMGSGKTSVGKKLANKLEKQFYDLDRFIEEKEGKSISEIFREIGESGFRELESKYLRELANQQNAVIALGGGTPCFSNNMEFIKSNGISIYLKLDESILVGRLRTNKTKRPLIANKTDEEISAFVRETLEQREPFYDQANYVLEGNHPNAKLIVSILND